MKCAIVSLLLILSSVVAAFAQPDLSIPPTATTQPQFEAFIDSAAPSEDAFIALQRLTYYPVNMGKWQEAIDIYKKYEPKFPAMHDRIERVIAILSAPAEDLSVRNLGSGVNTRTDEFSPVISVDGKKLYFTRENGQSRMESGEDVMLSEFDGTWKTATMLDTTIDTQGNESVNGVSADGTRLFLFGNYPGSLGSGDLFYSDKQPDGSWGTVEHFPPPVNTPYYEADGNITSDGKALLFSSDRPGGVGPFHSKGDVFHGDRWGNTDIYVSLRQPDGTWGDPINLGPVINTEFAERKPFLHPDGKTLYFCSDGHAGLGMMDIFKSTRLREDSWTEWSEPVNLGKEINNAADNFGFRVSTDGNTAYMSLDNRPDGYGQGDIYAMTLAAAARPDAIATIQGVVTDENGKPLSASIKWDDLEAKKNVGELSSDPKAGDYFITLPLGKNYGYYAEKEGYYPVSKNVDLRQEKNSVARTENIVMVSIRSMRENATTVRLNNVFFDFDKATLKPESYPELDRLVDILKKNPDLKAEIGGHTDNKGTRNYNTDLSKRRTQAVLEYLTNKGCDPKMLVTKGYGDSVPVATNDTEEGRAQNRRVEIRFLK